MKVLVFDNEKQPLFAVNVYAAAPDGRPDGTNRGTITDANGAANIPSDWPRVGFSYVGKTPVSFDRDSLPQTVTLANAANMGPQVEIRATRTYWTLGLVALLVVGAYKKWF